MSTPASARVSVPQMLLSLMSGFLSVGGARAGRARGLRPGRGGPRSPGRRDACRHQNARTRREPRYSTRCSRGLVRPGVDPLLAAAAGVHRGRRAAAPAGAWRPPPGSWCTCGRTISRAAGTCPPSRSSATTWPGRVSLASCLERPSSTDRRIQPVPDCCSREGPALSPSAGGAVGGPPPRCRRRRSPAPAGHDCGAPALSRPRRARAHPPRCGPAGRLARFGPPRHPPAGPAAMPPNEPRPSLRGDRTWPFPRSPPSNARSAGEGRHRPSGAGRGQEPAQVLAGVPGRGHRRTARATTSSAR